MLPPEAEKPCELHSLYPRRIKRREPIPAEPSGEAQVIFLFSIGTCRRLCIATKEAILLPLWALGVAGYLHRQRTDNLFKLGGGAEINRLGQIVGRGVITVR